MIRWTTSQKYCSITKVPKAVLTIWITWLQCTSQEEKSIRTCAMVLIVDIAGIASYILWLGNNPDWNLSQSTRRQRIFLTELGYAIYGDTSHETTSNLQSKHQSMLRWKTVVVEVQPRQPHSARGVYTPKSLEQLPVPPLIFPFPFLSRKWWHLHLQIFPSISRMEHLLEAFYGVDGPALSNLQKLEGHASTMPTVSTR